jgi:carboxylesterase type B
MDLWGADDAGEISDPLYNGCNLATDSIVVSISYRIGALGFLALKTAGISVNFGVQDILHGLD